MAVPTPPQALAALATLVRSRLAEYTAARQVATAIVSAAAPFAPNAYARARLIRQMHAGGLLSGDEARAADQALRHADVPADAGASSC